MRLSHEQTQVHQRAMTLAKNHRVVEASLVEVLQQVDRLKIYKALEKNSLFSYAVEVLGLDKNVAYPLITIARKATSIPDLKLAIENQSLTVSKASRIVSSLNSVNAKELIEFARTHTRDEIDFEIAKRNPKAGSYDKMKPLSEEFVEIKMCLPRETFEKLKRAESLEAQKQNAFQWADVLDAALEVYLDKSDPVRKAERASRKIKAANQISAAAQYRRIPLTAEQKHAVFLRDKGKCTHLVEGQRCNSDKWTQTHHIIPVSRGGTNDPENLTTLCSFHHDLVHQLSLPIEGQVSWLRSPQGEYRVVG